MGKICMADLQNMNGYQNVLNIIYTQIVSTVKKN